MATVQEVRTTAWTERFMLHNISWTTYESLLDDHTGASAPRFTYDRGSLEIMSPRPDHEEVNRAINLLIELVAAELDIDVRNLGSTTFRREDLERGFEPDSCFFIRSTPVVRDGRTIDLTAGPPPDLVVEVDVTHSSIDKLSLFAALGVLEVWHVDGQKVRFLVLEGQAYVPTEESRAFPGVTSGAVSMRVSSIETTGRATWLRQVQEWARELPKS